MKIKFYKRRKSVDKKEAYQAGFSLIELMITLAIASILLMATFNIFSVYSKTNTTQVVITDVQQNLRAALGLMEQEIRTAGFNPNGVETGVGIIAASSTNLQFTSDLDWDNNEVVSNFTASGIDEDITYSYNAGTNQLLRTDSAGTTLTILDDVTVTFSYLDGTAPAIDLGDPVSNANLVNIRTVDITLQMAKNVPRQSNPVSRTINTRVFCRNMNL